MRGREGGVVKINAGQCCDGESVTSSIFPVSLEESPLSSNLRLRRNIPALPDVQIPVPVTGVGLLCGKIGAPEWSWSHARSPPRPAGSSAPPAGAQFL